MHNVAPFLDLNPLPHLHQLPYSVSDILRLSLSLLCAHSSMTLWQNHKPVLWHHMWLTQIYKWHHLYSMAAPLKMPPSHRSIGTMLLKQEQESGKNTWLWYKKSARIIKIKRWMAACVYKQFLFGVVGITLTYWSCQTFFRLVWQDNIIIYLQCGESGSQKWIR